MSTYGLGVLALGEIQAAENHAARQRGSAEMSWKVGFEKYVFRAKSHVHGLRAVDYAHMQTEDQLIAALKAENANHPLASREAVDAAFEDERVKALLNPEVIRKTFGDEGLPKGAVIGNPPIGVQTIA